MSVQQQQIQTSNVLDKQQFFSYDEAVGLISDRLLRADADKQHFRFPSNFYEFVRDIWALSYDNPDWFSEWYIELLCSDLQRSIESGKHYVAQLPRGHLKSTVLGYAFAVWYPGTLEDSDVELLYLSYTDGMSRYHIEQIKGTVSRNPILSKHMTDLATNAISVFRYMVNGHVKKILDGGLFKFKRGMHTDGLVADDLLRDPSNPLNLTQLEKVENHFLSESMLIPNPGAPIIAFGTPMAPDDLLYKLSIDDSFNSRILPALNPMSGYDVLAPKIRSKEWLLDYKQRHPVAFQSEFALVPYLSTQSYLQEDDVKLCMKPLENLNPTKKYNKRPSEFIFAGVDIGKKRHPSHVSVYSAEIPEQIGIEPQIRQIYQAFLDNWDYVDQKDFLNEIAENFLIDIGYVDNTNGVLEERGLSKTWVLITSTKSMNFTMAQIFEEYVHIPSMFEMIEDERQLSQIVCVDINLKAPETIHGHGDSFFSNALALLAFRENYKNQTAILGDIQTIFKREEDIDNFRRSTFTSISGNIDACQKCGTSGMLTASGKCIVCYSALLDMKDIEFKRRRR